MDLDLVPILADAIKGYYEDNELSELCDLYGIQLTFDGMRPAYMRLVRDLIGGIGNSAKRRFLRTMIESLLNRAREGAGKTKWNRQEYHRSMVDSLSRVQTQFERIASPLDESGTHEQILATPDAIASVLRTDVKTVLSLLESGQLDGFKIGDEWRVPTDSFLDFLKIRISDQRMKTLVDNFQKPEFWARALEDFPNLKKQIADTDYEEGTMGAFLKNLVPDTENASFLPNMGNSQEVRPMPNQRQVFVVHGRDDRLRRDFFAFLRALDLQPLEWSEALRLTGKASPYIGEVLDKAFDNAQAVVVLLTPDDEVRLVQELWLPNEEETEKEMHFQARPNVLFEAGMAFGRNPDRTLLVQAGRVKAFSDVAGRHVVRLTNSPESRQDVAERLRTAGCAVSTSGRDWLRQGDFAVGRGENQSGSEHRQEEPTVKWVDSKYPHDVGLQAELESQGYRVRWCSEDALARRLDIEGWSLVTQTTESGQNVVLKVKDSPHNQTLIMRRDVAVEQK